MKAPRLRSLITLLTIICFAFLASVSHAQDYEFIIQHEGNARAIGNYQNYTYFNQGGNIHVLENLVNNEFNIINTFRTNYNSIAGITIDSNIMYISVYSGGVLIYDLSNPVYPEFISKADGFSTGALVQDTILIATSTSSAAFYNISNLLQPEYMYFLNFDHSYDNAYAINNDILYGFMIEGFSGPQFLVGYNIRNSEGPYFPEVYLQVCDNWSCPQPYYFEAYNNMLFAPQGNAMKIYDIADTDTIIYLTEFAVPNTVSHISIENDTAYLTIVDSGVFIYDISDIYQVEQIGNYNQTHRFNNVKVYEDYFFGSHGSAGFRIVDKSNFLNFQEVYEFTKTEAVWEICTHGNLGYFATVEAGLQIIDLTDDLNTVDLGNTDSLKQIQNIKYHQNYLYCKAQPDSTIKVVDVSDLNNPLLVSEVIAEEKSISDYCVDQDYLYILEKWEKIEKYDISNPESPVLTNTHEIHGNALDVSYPHLLMGEFVGDYPSDTKLKLLTFQPNGQLIFNDEYILGASETYSINQIIIKHPYIYVRVRDGLVVLKIGTGGLIEFCDELLWEGNSTSFDMVMDENYIYLSHGGLQVIDKTDPYNLVVTQTISDYFRKIDIRNNHIYGAATTNGYFVYSNDLTGKTVSKIKENNLDFICSPNPCSNSTKIDFCDNVGMLSKLEIYNLSGKKIFEVETTNEKSIQLSTNSITPGIYLVKHSSGDNISTQKLIVTK